jgi:carboxymethylenebutenolidase
LASKDVTFELADDTNMLACLATPEVEKKSPGIIVIHEAYGLNDQIRGVARRYADNGFVALAPHLFSRNSDLMNEKNIEGAMRQMWSLPPEKRRDPAALAEVMKTMSETDRKIMKFFFEGREAMEKEMAIDLMRCVEYLKGVQSVNPEKLGVTGFCLGGGLTYQISTSYPFSASVPYYGANPRPIESVEKISGPVLAFYAGEDDRINEGIPEIVGAMVRYKKEFEMKVYKGAQHAFFNETRPVYSRVAAEDAWELTMQFLNKHLKM